jgi:hypothetical protein
MERTNSLAQRLHPSLSFTLETYVHWWPKKDRRRNLVGSALRGTATHREGTAGNLPRR